MPLHLTSLLHKSQILLVVGCRRGGNTGLRVSESGLLMSGRLRRNLDVVEFLNRKFDVVLLECVGPTMLGQLAGELGRVLDELVRHLRKDFFYLRVQIVLA